MRVGVKGPLTLLVDGFQHQQHGSKLEDGGADKGSPASANVGFPWELGGGSSQGEPHEEAVDDPYNGACGVLVVCSVSGLSPRLG